MCRNNNIALHFQNQVIDLFSDPASQAGALSLCTHMIEEFTSGARSSALGVSYF